MVVFCVILGCFFSSLFCIFEVFYIDHVIFNEFKRLFKNMCLKMQNLLTGSPYSPRFVNSSALSGSPRQLIPTRPAAACLKAQQAAWISVSGPPASCTAVTPYSLSCFHYGELRARLARERVLLELSRDEGAKNGCGSPRPSGSTICASGLAIPSRPWIIFRIHGGLPDHLVCGTAQAAHENHSGSVLKQMLEPHSRPIRSGSPEVDPAVNR